MLIVRKDQDNPNWRNILENVCPVLLTSQGLESQEKTEKLRRAWRHTDEMKYGSWTRKRDINGKMQKFA